LPPESRYQTALRNSLTAEQITSLTSGHDPEQERWSRLESLVAGLHEQLQLLRIDVASVVGGEPPEFQPIYRPGVPMDEQARPESPEERDERRAMLQARWDATKKSPLIGS
jgi:hypothetical protein